MKRFLTSLIFTAAALLFCAPAFADTVYPYSNPTYIPSADMASATYTAPSTAYAMTLNGIGTVSLRVTGTCTSLAATLQGSNDSGSNYTALNLYPIATGTAAPTAVPPSAPSASGRSTLQA